MSQTDLTAACGAILEESFEKDGKHQVRLWRCNRPKWVPHAEHRVTDERAVVIRHWIR